VEREREREKERRKEIERLKKNAQAEASKLEPGSSLGCHLVLINAICTHLRTVCVSASTWRKS
jgi:hypothetical protein